MVRHGQPQGQFRNLIGFTDPNQGFAESYPSEAYLNAGLPGCLLAGVFFGALMGWAWRKRRAVPRQGAGRPFPVLLAGLVYGFRSDALAPGEGRALSHAGRVGDDGLVPAASAHNLAQYKSYQLLTETS